MALPRSAYRTKRWRARTGLRGALTVIGGGTLAALAFFADLERPGVPVADAIADVAVGAAFMVGARLAPQRARARGWFAGVGAIWLAGSIVTPLAVAHQGVLLIGLVVLVTGRRLKLPGWGLVTFAILIALQVVARPWTVAAFALASALALRVRPRTEGNAYAAAAGFAVASAVGVAWIAENSGADSSWRLAFLHTYELLLAAVGITFPFVARATLASRGLADRILTGASAPALDDLAVVLRALLGDPDLKIERWGDADPGELGATEGAPAAGPRARRRYVADAGGATRLAVIEYHSPALDDEATAEAVFSAVRLAVAHQELDERLGLRLAELTAARARLVDAVDRERDHISDELRRDVLDPVERATAQLREVRPGEGAASHDVLGGPEGFDDLAVAIGELEAVADDVAAIVRNQPSAELGGGRLVAAVEALAERTALPVSLTARGDVAGGPGAETTLFFVCAEALANAVKHAGASRIAVTLDFDERALTATVVDDGCGGADPGGSGLRGLADRLAARGGRLRVESPSGGGTVVRASVPP